MGSFIKHRVFQVLVTCFAISIITFLLMHLTQDPVLLLMPPDASREDIEGMRHDLGFDRPIFIQYAKFLSRAVQGDFGVSLFSRRPAFAMVLERLPATILLTVAALLISLLLSVPLGVTSAVRRGSWVDNVCTLLSILGQAIPLFWFGIMMMIVFSINLKLLPASGYGSWKHLIMPAVSLAIWIGPITMRLIRSQMIDVLSQEYVRTARAKGLSQLRVVWQHSFKNAIVPVITVVGAQFGQLLGGAIVCETVFAWPGVASLTVFAIRQSDFPVVQAGVTILGLFIVVVNMCVDLLAAYLDPRISIQ